MIHLHPIDQEAKPPTLDIDFEHLLGVIDVPQAHGDGIDEWRLTPHQLVWLGTRMVALGTQLMDMQKQRQIEGV